MTDDAAFPTVRWDELEVTFIPKPLQEGSEPFAVVVFAIRGGGFVLADVVGRGWITPSGRLEPGESTLQAALRETREEIGADLLKSKPCGYYEIRMAGGELQRAEAFVGAVDSFGDIPPGSESRGARLVMPEELPTLYWRWDPLLEAMFTYALKVYSSPSSETSPFSTPK